MSSFVWNSAIDPDGRLRVLASESFDVIQAEKKTLGQLAGLIREIQTNKFLPKAEQAEHVNALYHRHGKDKINVLLNSENSFVTLGGAVYEATLRRLQCSTTVDPGHVAKGVLGLSERKADLAKMLRAANNVVARSREDTEQFHSKVNAMERSIVAAKENELRNNTIPVGDDPGTEGPTGVTLNGNSTPGEWIGAAIFVIIIIIAIAAAP